MEDLTVLKWQEGVISVRNETTGYGVFLNANVPDTSYNSVIVGYPLEGSGMIATGRELDFYADCFRDAPPRPDQRLVEVGAGLSAFIPGLVQHRAQHLRHKPVIIDPIDYGKAAGILRDALRIDSHPVVYHVSRRIQEFIRRCEIILGGGVDHIPKTLRTAISEDLTLSGSADYVLSIYGPTKHPGPRARLSDDQLESLRDSVMDDLRALLRDPTESILKVVDQTFEFNF